MRIVDIEPVIKDFEKTIENDEDKLTRAFLSILKLLPELELITSLEKCKEEKVDAIKVDSELAPIVIEAVKKQIPIRPKNVKTYKIDGKVWESGVCECGASVTPSERHCDNCGQRLDWIEAETE